MQSLMSNSFVLGARQKDQITLHPFAVLISASKVHTSSTVVCTCI